jgi:1-acyl-sn-glycerol-3-phosphate acyltransferase
MFPEGTRSPDGRLQTAEPGAALLALRTGTPILPIALIGAHRVLPKGSRRLRFVPVQIRIGPLLQVPRIEGRLDTEILDQWGERIISEIGKLLPSDQGGRWVEKDQKRGAEF